MRHPIASCRRAGTSSPVAAAASGSTSPRRRSGACAGTSSSTRCTRLGKVADAEALVGAPVILADEDFRTSVRVLVRKGRPAFRRASSHDPVLVDACVVAHPLLDDLIKHASFDGVTEAELRCGAADGGAARHRLPRPRVT